MNINKLPKARYETIMYCPTCGWHGNNNEDIGATSHEMIKTKTTEKGKEYFHCTCCQTDFKK